MHKVYHNLGSSELPLPPQSQSRTRGRGVNRLLQQVMLTCSCHTVPELLDSLLQETNLVVFPVRKTLFISPLCKAVVFLTRPAMN